MHFPVFGHVVNMVRSPYLLYWVAKSNVQAWGIRALTCVQSVVCSPLCWTLSASLYNHPPPPRGFPLFLGSGWLHSAGSCFALNVGLRFCNTVQCCKTGKCQPPFFISIATFKYIGYHLDWLITPFVCSCCCSHPESSRESSLYWQLQRAHMVCQFWRTFEPRAWICSSSSLFVSLVRGKIGAAWDWDVCVDEQNLKLQVMHMWAPVDVGGGVVEGGVDSPFDVMSMFNTWECNEQSMWQGGSGYRVWACRGPW